MSVDQTLDRDAKINKTKFLALSLAMATVKTDHSNTMVMDAIILALSWGGTNHTEGTFSPFYDGDEGF